ncbi:MAG: AraC-like DNA-binding protein [Saprospiraceae bacterium]
MSIYIGNALIGLAFFFANKATYIMGPLVFSVLSYWLGFLWYYRNQSNVISTSPTRAKYENRRIPVTVAVEMENKLRKYLLQSEVYSNTQLKSSEVAIAINTKTHKLSQLINDNLNTNYNALVNTYRIKAAQELIVSTPNLSLEGIATEVGFKSKSSFYEAFKKEVRQTPGIFKKSLSKGWKEKGLVKNSFFCAFLLTFPRYSA